MRGCPACYLRSGEPLPGVLWACNGDGSVGQFFSVLSAGRWYEARGFPVSAALAGYLARPRGPRGCVRAIASPGSHVCIDACGDGAFAACKDTTRRKIVRSYGTFLLYDRTMFFLYDGFLFSHDRNSSIILRRTERLGVARGGRERPAAGVPEALPHNITLPKRCAGATRPSVSLRRRRGSFF